ncbi:MAG: GTPase HflX, partial [Candidatus Omnitrophica bacterium]|nr:GTPase HflX [Candidatus Omnitrophota bacterium]
MPIERALLVTVKLDSEKDNWPIEDVASELEELVSTCGAEVVDNIYCRCAKPTSNLFIGKGKTEELAILAQENNIDVLIFGHDLSGTQQRNLEEI